MSLNVGFLWVKNFEQDIFSQKLVRSGDRVIPRIKDSPDPYCLNSALLN